MEIKVHWNSVPIASSACIILKETKNSPTRDCATANFIIQRKSKDASKGELTLSERDDFPLLSFFAPKIC